MEETEWIWKQEKHLPMCMIYNEAWGNAKRGIPLTDSGSVNSDSLQNAFDVQA